MNDISIIIPFYNELENVSFLVSEIENFVKKNEKLKFEIVLIDDGSGDNSVESFLAHLTDFICDVKIVKLSKNFGSHAAVRSGLLVATSKYNVFISADLQDPLNLVIDL